MKILDDTGLAKVWSLLKGLTDRAQSTADEALETAQSLDSSKQDKLTLPLSVSNGGTGLSSSPSMLTNLASASAASVLQASPRPGVTGTLPIANGGTGNTSGLAASATKLATPRTIQTSLASTSSASFDGTGNVTPGITGTLPVSHGGTGSTTASGARSNLGLSATGVSISPNENLANYSSYTNGSQVIGNLLILQACIILSTATNWSSNTLTLFTITTDSAIPSTERTILRSCVVISGSTGDNIYLRGITVNTSGTVVFNNLSSGTSSVLLVLLPGIPVRL